MDAQVIAVRLALEQHEAVGHLAGIAAAEELVSDHSHRLHEARVGELLQYRGDARLGGGVGRGFGAEIEPVESVEAGQAEQGHQPGAHLLGRLLLDEGDLGDRRRFAAEAQAGLERRVAQRPIDDPEVGEEAQIGVGQDPQPVAIGEQVMGRQPLGEQQGEHLAIDFALARQLGVALGRPGERLVGLGEIGAEPDPQRLGQADHLAVAGERAERRRIEVGRDDLLAPRHRLRAL